MKALLHKSNSNIRKSNKKIGFYYITDTTITGMTHYEQIKSLFENNLNLKYIQYREKRKSIEEMKSDLEQILELKKSYSTKTKLIINDYLELAFEYADGVHLGKDDINLKEAIKLVENFGKKLNIDFEIGVSATSLEEVKFLQANFLDKISYIGFGPIFHTKTKRDAAIPVGLNSLKIVMKISKLPIVAIGGINSSNLKSVLDCQPNGIAAISMVLKEKEIDFEIIRLIQEYYGLL